MNIKKRAVVDLISTTAFLSGFINHFRYKRSEMVYHFVSLEQVLVYDEALLYYGQPVSEAIC